MLNVDELAVNYGEIPALQNVSLHVEEKEIVGVLGANGAGKTTFFRTVAGLNKPRLGKIEFNGKRIDRLGPHEIVAEGISYVPEGRRLFPYMTVEENLLAGSYVKRARAKRNENMRNVYELFPILKERREQLAGTLSGGEQQMLAIARGLMSEPRLLLLDEPSLGLAPKLVMQIFELITQVNKRNITIMLADQNISKVIGLAHRVYAMERGHVVAVSLGKKIVICDYPQCPKRVDGKSCGCELAACEQMRGTLGL